MIEKKNLHQYIEKCFAFAGTFLALTCFVIFVGAARYVLMNWN